MKLRSESVENGDFSGPTGEIKDSIFRAEWYRDTFRSENPVLNRKGAIIGARSSWLHAKCGLIGARILIGLQAMSGTQRVIAPHMTLQSAHTHQGTKGLCMPGEEAFAKSLQELSELPTSDLREVRYSLAEFLHQHFLRAVERGFKGLVVCDPMCAGKAGDAFATNNGSSKYVRGALTPTHQGSSELDALALVGYLEGFLETIPLDMKVDLVLGIARQGTQFQTFIYERGKGKHSPEQMIAIPDHAREGTEARKEVASVAMLLTVGKWLARELDDVGLLEGLEMRLQKPSIPPVGMLKEAQLIKAASFEAWREIAEVIKELPPIIVGESFTFGKLADVLSSHESVKPLATAYGWYDSNYKVAVGVPQELVDERVIAEPATVSAGAKGLIRTFGTPESLAIATSGWANFWKDNEADFFSVAVSGSLGGVEHTQARRFTVTSTNQQPRERGRRDVTRELGVAVSLSMLATHLEQANPAHAQSIAAVRGKLDSVIARFG